MKIRSIFNFIPIPIIVCNIIARKRWGRACWLFVAVRKNYYNDEGLIQHELEHCRQMWRTAVIGYAILYFFSKKYRLKAEVQAYKVQIEHGSISVSHAAMLIASTYGLNLDVAQIKILLTE